MASDSEELSRLAYQLCSTCRLYFDNIEIYTNIVLFRLGLIGISSLLCFIGVCGTCGKTREMRIITVIFAIILFLADLVGLGLVIAIFPGVVQKYMRKSTVSKVET